MTADRYFGPPAPEPITAYDILCLALAAPGSTYLRAPHRPPLARAWDRHALDAVRALFDFEPIFAGLAIRKQVHKRRRC